MTESAIVKRKSSSNRKEGTCSTCISTLLHSWILHIYKTYIGETHYKSHLYFSQSSARHIIRLRHRIYYSAAHHFEAPQLIRKINSLKQLSS
jgi:hypothetical protein